MGKRKSNSKQQQKGKRKQRGSGDSKSSIGVSVRYDHVDLKNLLVIGDGDFSFSRGLCKHRGNKGAGIYATAYDQQQEVLEKYPASASTCIEATKKAGATVLFAVDGRYLHNNPNLCTNKFDRVIFNFPHTGMQRTHLNRNMLREFFASSRALLSQGGQIHVTIKLKPPYSNWKIEEQAATSGLKHLATLDFEQTMFPGYRHQTTKSDASTFQAAAQHEAKHCKTLIFVDNPNAGPKLSVKPRKRRANMLPSGSQQDATTVTNAKTQKKQHSNHKLDPSNSESKRKQHSNHKLDSSKGESKRKRYTGSQQKDAVPNSLELSGDQGKARECTSQKEIRESIIAALKRKQKQKKRKKPTP